MRLPVEIGGERAGLPQIEQRAGGAGGKAHGTEALYQPATVNLSAQEGVNEVFLFLMHFVFSSTG
ncbi:hypothetical protein MesoLj113a_59670 [Mesorhizobium sp. 113-1-2]|nr:hypothetical protein MesoLj113a_59670 [Mesorhizobium sp. 113-1-2]